ncbi:MAG TPA: proton-conducting membrane transporter, partial [Bacteroidales bacterium]|nr:proton-conducting membrane transporter [Bacteroidales bacterium]
MNQEIIEIVDQIIQEKGKSVDLVIPILQAIQDKFNYLPEEALERVCETTDITPSRIYGVSTFYSQFRHKPVGEHIIKVCVGTACHVKGAMLVYDAFKRELEIEGNEDTDVNKLFTVEKIACLGCCTLAPVVQIDDTTYGHVTTEKISEIIEDFLENKDNPKSKQSSTLAVDVESQGEIRIGLGSCCVASGSSDVKNELENTLTKNHIHVNVKQVGCVGVCNQVPMLEIHKPNETPSYYTKINSDEVRSIVLKHFQPLNPFDKFKSRFNNFIEGFVYENIPNFAKKYAKDEVNTPISDFLEGQINIATEYRGEIKPSDIEEYKRLGGFQALKKCLNQMTPQNVIDEIKESGLKGRGGGGFLSGNKWQMVKDNQSDVKYIICNGDEGDPGAFMDRMLLESYPFRIIEGLIIAGYAVGASEGILYIRAEYPLAVTRIKEGIEICER